ncbi:MAG TPA: MFS transporter [Clostridia bacterium]|nr:MFS transporter [Clostridia bacterium]
MRDESGTEQNVVDVRSRRPQGMAAFTIVWFGQVVSLVGTAMTGFALTLWAYRTTGLATALSMVAFFGFAPMIIMSPIAGVLVDRWNRKWTMALSDLASAIGTLTILILFASGHLQLWHLYVVGALTAVFQSFQWPAYSAAISMMVPKTQYQRASGMISMAESGSGIAAPILAGALIGVVGFERLWVIFAIDLVTFAIALSTLVAVTIPNPPRTVPEKEESFLRQSTFGFRYIWNHRPLFNLQMMFFSSNLLASLCVTILPTMILARTGNNSTVLATVQSASAVGGVIGGAALTAWGGPKRKVDGVLLGMVFASLFGTVILGLGRSLPVWAVGGFMSMLFLPMLNGSNQAIWQSKVPPSLQGRVFSIRLIIAQVTAPIAMLASGPLADKVFGPAMLTSGPLAPVFSWLTGTGTGAGISLMFVLFGLAGAVAGMAGYLIPSVRNVERLIPDHDTPTVPESV